MFTCCAPWPGNMNAIGGFSCRETRVKTRPASSVSRAFPPGEPGIDVERAVREINFGIGRFEEQAGRKLLVVQRQRGFYQAGDASRRVQMTDVGFYRADGAGIFRR